MPPRRRLRALALLACLMAAGSASPQSASAQEPNSANVAAARRHFDRARAHYASGAYREAIAELEAAHALDPTAKDLVFNLGVVHERLGDIDDALQWFHLYTTMDLTPPERERADAYVRRLEGAKRELAQKANGVAAPGAATRPGPAPSAGSASNPPPDAQQTPAPAHGRIDAATITAIALAGVGLAFGTVMAVKAEDDRPSNFVTGRDGSYAELVSRTDLAHREAIAADIGFGAGAAAAVTAAILYFARTRDAAGAGPGQAPATTPASVSVLPLLPVNGAGGGGGVLFVQGSL